MPVVLQLICTLSLFTLIFSYKYDVYTQRAYGCSECFSKSAKDACLRQTLKCVRRKDPSLKKRFLRYIKAYHGYKAKETESEYGFQAASLIRRLNSSMGYTSTTSVNVYYPNRPQPAVNTSYCEGFSALYRASTAATRKCQVDIGTYVSVTAAGLGTLLGDELSTGWLGRKFGLEGAQASLVESYGDDPDYVYNSLFRIPSKKDPTAYSNRILAAFKPPGLFGSLIVGRSTRWDQAAKVFVFSKKSARKRIIRKAVEKLENKGFVEDAFHEDKKKYSSKKVANASDGMKKYVVIVPFSKEFLQKFPR